MKQTLSRRDFLKLSALSVSSLAFRPTYNFGELMEDENLARVAIDSVSVYSAPDEKSTIKFQRYRDEVFHIYREVESDKEPLFNPLWYKVWGGYIHSAYTQRVKASLNPIVENFNDDIKAAEITVPYSQSYYKRNDAWVPIYRLYYGTNHWVTGLSEGPDGGPWYRIKDERFATFDSQDYFVPAQHVRLLTDAEMSPISADVNPNIKYVEVSLANQRLTAYEGSKIVMNTTISSGLDYHPVGEVPLNTPTGTFYVQNKMFSKHMGYAIMTDDLEEYILPGVPWVCFFEPQDGWEVFPELDGGYAFHGTYWHTNFGTPMSHGCINLRNEEAKWLFRWLTPVYKNDQMSTIGMGTKVIIY
jgi:lipoprotein-anchoring transpeptidase ErfK/SrfK